jgi:hypothetical protein
MLKGVALCAAPFFYPKLNFLWLAFRCFAVWTKSAFAAQLRSMLKFGCMFAVVFMV